MDKNKKTVIITAAVLALIVIGYLAAKKEIVSRATKRDNEYISSFLRQGVPNPKEPLTTYTETDYGISFDHPISWGSPEVLPGSKTCPDKPNFYTPETLQVYDRELRFNDIDLPNTDSFIRTGVKFYRVDPNNLNDCGDELFLSLAKGEFNDAYTSSFYLTGRTGVPGFLFTHFRRFVSTMNIDGRQHYTYVVRFEEGGKLLVAQFYMSFISEPGSREIKEMEDKFNGDVYAYMENGGWAYPVRQFQERFWEAATTFKIVDSGYKK